MDSFSRSNRGDKHSRTNPSLGLKIWGPLVPANDCKGCLATLAGLQLGAGALLWIVPGRHRPPARGIWTNRFIKLGGILAGSYLIFKSGIEFSRLALPYDPWVEDARIARRNENMLRPVPLSKWSPATWWYDWFGPSSYTPVPWSEWRRRTTEYLDRVEKARPHVEKLREAHEVLCSENMAIADDILARIKANKLAAPEIPVQELEALSNLSDFDDEQEFYDEIDLTDADLWEFFEEPQAFSVVVIPRSSPAFLEGVKIPNEAALKSQLVNYMSIPQSLKHDLRP